MDFKKIQKGLRVSQGPQSRQGQTPRRQRSRQGDDISKQGPSGQRRGQGHGLTRALVLQHVPRSKKACLEHCSGNVFWLLEGQILDPSAHRMMNTERNGRRPLQSYASVRTHTHTHAWANRGTETTALGPRPPSGPRMRQLGHELLLPTHATLPAALLAATGLLARAALAPTAPSRKAEQWRS